MQKEENCHPHDLYLYVIISSILLKGIQIRCFRQENLIALPLGGCERVLSSVWSTIFHIEEQKE